MKEIWKSVVGYEGLYKVSNIGRVKSISRLIHGKSKCTYVYNGKILKNLKTDLGYLRVCLSKSPKIKYFSVHRLVGIAFIENKKSCRCINHKDGKKYNNIVSNLEWCTYKENTRHAIETGLRPVGSAHGNAKLKESDILNIRELYNSTTISFLEISKKYNVSRTTLFRAYHGKTWKHVI